MRIGAANKWVSKMNKEWCVYTGNWYAASDMTNEHVIALSIGGHDSFTIRTSRSGNDRANQTLDEKVKGLPLIASFRGHYQFRGHRDNRPLVRWPSKLGDLNVNLDLSDEAIRVESFRSKGQHAINFRRAAGEADTFSSTFSLDLNLLLRFGCRLALGSAYFLFGDTFRNYGYHEELRKLMNSPAAVQDLRFRLANKKGPGFWAVSCPESSLTLGPLGPLWKALLSQQDRHCFFTLHTVAEIVLGISLFGGLFRWYFNIANDTDRFPIGGEFELGSATEIVYCPHEFRRSDLRSYLARFQRALRRHPGSVKIRY